jgi:hypothetical protein
MPPQINWFVYDALRCKCEGDEMNPGMGYMLAFTNDSQCLN